MSGESVKITGQITLDGLKNPSENDLAVLMAKARGVTGDDVTSPKSGLGGALRQMAGGILSEYHLIKKDQLNG